MTDPLALLRERTRPQHDALESSAWLDDALRGFDTYARHLASAAAFYAAAEAALAAHHDALAARGFEPDARRKTPLIAAELAALRSRGVCVPVAEAAAFPALRSLSDAVGALYVLEGATLGGVLIARAVRERLDWASTFYGGYGERTAQRWREFGHAARACVASLDAQQLVAAAEATFAAYGTEVAALAA